MSELNNTYFGTKSALTSLTQEKLDFFMLNNKDEGRKDLALYYLSNGKYALLYQLLCDFERAQEITGNFEEIKSSIFFKVSLIEKDKERDYTYENERTSFSYKEWHEKTITMYLNLVSFTDNVPYHLRRFLNDCIRFNDDYKAEIENEMMEFLISCREEMTEKKKHIGLFDCHFKVISNEEKTDI